MNSLARTPCQFANQSRRWAASSATPSIKAHDASAQPASGAAARLRVAAGEPLTGRALAQDELSTALRDRDDLRLEHPIVNPGTAKPHSASYTRVLHLP